MGYRVRGGPTGGYDAKLMVLEEKWLEPLGAISPASIEAEGFESIAEFRRYWMQREKRRFAPTRMVTVYRVRPWTDQDHVAFGTLLIDRLYGEHLAPAQ